MTAMPNQITVKFRVFKESLFGERRDEWKTIRTGKKTYQEAMEVAVSNGANPYKSIMYISEP